MEAEVGSNSWLGKLESLLDSEGKSTKSHFELPEHVEAGLSPQQQAEDYALHVSRISRDYVPLTRATLPDRLSLALEQNECVGHPTLEDHTVYGLLRDRKVTGGVEGDLDPRVVKSCMLELTKPMACIYRCAVDSHTWPDSWKLEKQVMINKCPHPATKDDMRNLGLSPFFNKGLEKVLYDWLFPYVDKYVSWDQFGGRKGCSTTHYLARYLDFIYAGLDSGKQGDRRAVVVKNQDEI